MHVWYGICSINENMNSRKEIQNYTIKKNRLEEEERHVHVEKNIFVEIMYSRLGIWLTIWP